MKLLNKPLIGVVPDFKEGSEVGYSIRPYYALRRNYVDMINESGGAAIILTYDYDLLDFYAEILDGLMIVGGYFDINPKRYGDNIVHPTVKINQIREDFEFQLVDKILQKNKMPIFGICNGMQLINIYHGGNVIQHIPDEKDNGEDKYLNHEQSYNPNYNDYKKPYHEVSLVKDSKLFHIVGADKINVNSSHHQAVKTTGSDIIASAKASDGIIEAVEHKTHPFCVGVQWHPEFSVSDADKKLFEAFVKAAKEYRV